MSTSKSANDEVAEIKKRVEKLAGIHLDDGEPLLYDAIVRQMQLESFGSRLDNTGQAVRGTIRRSVEEGFNKQTDKLRDLMARITANAEEKLLRSLDVQAAKRETKLQESMSRYIKQINDLHAKISSDFTCAMRYFFYGCGLLLIAVILYLFFGRVL